MKLLDDVTISQVVTRKIYPGYRAKRDGMTKVKSGAITYEIAGRCYIAEYRLIYFALLGNTYEIWVASIDEEQLAFYKNLRQVVGGER